MGACSSMVCWYPTPYPYRLPPTLSIFLCGVGGCGWCGWGGIHAVMHDPLYILIGRYLNKTLTTVEIPTTAGVFLSVLKNRFLGNVHSISLSSSNACRASSLVAISNRCVVTFSSCQPCCAFIVKMSATLPFI